MLPLNPFATPRPATKPALQFPAVSEGPSPHYFAESFIDQRLIGFRGKSRSVSLPNASSSGGSAISRSPDGSRCAVAGKDSLRIIRVVEPSEKHLPDHWKGVTGKGGYRIETTRNQWASSGLKVDSALTDVVWCHKSYDTKILTSARNGELMVWDLHRSGSVKYERKIKCHPRSINKLAYHSLMPHYCSTASSDGNLRLWDLRDLSKASYYIHHTFAIRTAICLYDSISVVTGLDNGSICRWDLRMGQKGIVERVPLAHTGPVLSFDWSSEGASGWLASAGQDRTVKIWDFTDSNSESTYASTRKPSYVLHASYPIRRVIWRPGYETELAIASTSESGFDLSSKISSLPSEAGLSDKLQATPSSFSGTAAAGKRETAINSGDLIEIWDVRRPWIAKWTVTDSDCEGGVSDMTFFDSHALWVQHISGAFSQMDLRYSNKPIESLSRTALTWTPTGRLTFLTDNPSQWEVPYDDRDPRPPWPSIAEKTESHKRIGDPSFRPSSQNLGVISGVAEEDWDSFQLQARGYKIEGADKVTLCEINSKVAYEAGDPSSENLWLLLQSLLTDLGPLPRLMSTAPDDPSLPRSVSAPGAVPTPKRSPLKDPQTRSSSSDPPNLVRKSSTGLAARKISAKLDGSIASPLSPRHPSITPMTPRPHATNNDVSFATSPSSNVTAAERETSRSTSFSTEKSSSSSSRRRRQIGEGALADSDDESDQDSKESRSASRSNITRDVFISQGTPTVGSRVAPRRFVSSPGVLEDIDDDWAEDEKEDDSASPASLSDSGSGGSVASTRVARSSSQQRRARNRAYAQASAPPNTLHGTANISRTDSQSSVLTVTVGAERSIVNETIAAPDASSVAPSTRSKSQNRNSLAYSLSGLNTGGNAEEEYPALGEDVNFLEWNNEIIKEREEHYRESAWDAFKTILEEMADRGDIQMCAMLSCVAPLELGINPMRALHFIEAYVDLLSRLRLHTAAAYVRKYAPLQEVRQSTQVQTTAYTNCSSCRKPILQPASGGRPWSGFSQCFECRRPVMNCTICHLPVRAAAFVCAVCSHGGHRNCYYQYYMHRPMVELSTASYEIRGRRSTRMPAGSSSAEEATDNSLKSEESLRALDRSVIRINGHPCAAGCGHHCWASSQKLVSA